MTDPPVKLSASQVSLILQRASEIDARGDTLSVEELRRIAAEAGIDAGATNTAIAEIMAEEEAPPVPAAPSARKAPATTSPFPSSLRILTGGAVGAAVGFLTTISDEAAILGIGTAVMYLLLRSLQSMKRGSQFDFQLQNFALWLGTMVAATASGFFVFDVFGGVFLAWFFSAILGGLLVRLGPKEEEGEGEEPPRIGRGSGP